MKDYIITISQDGKYPNYKSETFGINASSMSVAVNRAIKLYQKQYKGKKLKSLKILAKRI